MTKKAKIKLKINSEVFCIGSVGYSIIEILWRGFTHWSMALAGGICFTIIYHLNKKFNQKPVWEKCLMGSAVITAVEFVIGCIVNLGLKMNVWNYNKMHFNFLGQICLLYSFLWFLLSFPLVFLCKNLQKKLHG